MNCINCNRPFADHPAAADGDRVCPDGKDRFNVTFAPSAEVMDFVKENLDKSPEELAAMWIEKLREKR